MRLETLFTRDHVTDPPFQLYPKHPDEVVYILNEEAGAILAVSKPKRVVVSPVLKADPEELQAVLAHFFDCCALNHKGPVPEVPLGQVPAFFSERLGVEPAGIVPGGGFMMGVKDKAGAIVEGPDGRLGIALFSSKVMVVGIALEAHSIV